MKLGITVVLSAIAFASASDVLVTVFDNINFNDDNGSAALTLPSGSCRKLFFSKNSITWLYQLTYLTTVLEAVGISGSALLLLLRELSAFFSRKFMIHSRFEAARKFLSFPFLILNPKKTGNHYIFQLLIDSFSFKQGRKLQWGERP